MKNLYIRFLRMLVHSLGKWSNGISLCLQHGLTSGMMLDYVYRNQASGRFLIGKFIDRLYLSHRGWESIRLRKDNLERLLQNAIQKMLEKQPDLLMVDVASGPARYILNTLKRFPGQSLRALCRDLDERWLEAGKKNAAAAGLTTVTFEKGDALNKESFGTIPAPDIMISSGFYDWITDDALIQTSMKVISETLKPAGIFIFTVQTGHVDMKMVSEIFPDFNHQPLRMTVRPAQAVISWAQALGFSLLDQAHDPWGYYTVVSMRHQ